MKYLQLGDRNVSQLVLGTMAFHMGDLDGAYSVFNRFSEAGGNAFDTAYIYSGGDCERVLGQWMKHRKNRSQTFVIAKGGHPNGSVPRPRIAPEEVRADLEVSLIRTQTDYFDLYLLHRDDERIPVSTVVDYMDQEIRRGRILAAGVSNWSPTRVQAANEYAVQSDKHPLIAISNNISLAAAKKPHWSGCFLTDQAAWDWHNENQFPLIPWSSQARGFFSGNFSPDKPDNLHVVDIYYTDDNFERLNRAQQLGQEKGCTAIQVALAYVMHQPFPTFPIFGPVNLDELNSSLGAVEVKLTEKEMQWLNLESKTLGS